MLLDEIFKMMPNDSYIHSYNAVINGKRKRIRLVNRYGIAYMMCRGKRKYGSILSTDVAQSITRLSLIDEKKVDLYTRFMKRLTQANEMLSKSGLWPSIKQAIEHALSLSPEEIRELVDELDKNSYEFYCEAQKKDSKYAWCRNFIELFSNFLKPRCFVSLRVSRMYMSPTQLQERIKEAIQNKTEFSFRWRNGYDNTVTVSHLNGVSTAHYSEEYKGCGNGHYYLLFDEKHAIHYEDD